MALLNRPGQAPILTLPTTRQPAQTSLKDYAALFYGVGSGIGCSSLLASIQHYLDAQTPQEKALYIDCDPSQSMMAHSNYRVSPKNWKEFLDYCKLAVASPDFTYICIDHLHAAYEWSWDVSCDKWGVTHPSEAGSLGKGDMGKTWGNFTKDYMTPISHLMAECRRANKGFVASCRSVNSQVSFKGSTYNLWVPSFIGGSARSTYARIVDLFPLIGFIHLEGITAPPTKMTDVKVVDLRAAAGPQEIKESRILNFNKGKHWEAKDRSRRFKEPITLPEDYREDWTLIEDIWERSGEK